MDAPDVMLRLHPTDDTLVDVRLDWAELENGHVVVPIAEAIVLRDRLDLAIEGATKLAAAHGYEISPGVAPVRPPAAPGDTIEYPDAVEPNGDQTPDGDR